MKINLFIEGEPLNGYLNLSSISRDNTTVVNLFNFDEVCPACCATEINAPKILDYIHGSQVINFLKYLGSRIRMGGKLIVGGTSLYETCKGAVSCQLNGAEVNKLLFGAVNYSPFIKQGMFDFPDIEQILVVNLGMKVIHKRLVGREFVIEAIRNDGK